MSRACLRCISKKRRCDHERPVCGSCGKLDVACEYPPPQSRRGPVPGLSKRAEWRVQQLENALCYVLGLPGVGAAVAREQSTATLPTAPTSQLDRVARSEWWADHRLDSVADVLEFRELCLGLDPSISGVGSGGTSVDTRVPESIASSSRRPILPSSSSLDALLLPIPIPQGGYFDIQPDLPGSASPDSDPLANTRPQYYPVPRHHGHMVYVPEHVVHVADPWDPRDRSGLHSHAHSEHELSRPQSRGLDLERLEHLEHLEQQHRHELEQQQQQQQHHEQHPHQPGPNDTDPYYDQRAYAAPPAPPAPTGSTSLRNSMGPSLWQLVTAAIPDANEDRTLVEVHEHHPLPSVWGEDELVNGMASSASVVLPPPPPPPPEAVNATLSGPRLGEVRAREELGTGELDGQGGVKRRMPDFW